MSEGASQSCGSAPEISKLPILAHRDQGVESVSIYLLLLLLLVIKIVTTATECFPNHTTSLG